MMVVVEVVVARCFGVATTWTENSSSILSLTFLKMKILTLLSDFTLLEWLIVDSFVHLLSMKKMVVAVVASCT